MSAQDSMVSLVNAVVESGEQHHNTLCCTFPSNLPGAGLLARRIKTELNVLHKGLQRISWLKYDNIMSSNLHQLGAVVQLAVALRPQVTSLLQKFRDENTLPVYVDIVANGGLLWIKVVCRCPNTLQLAYHTGSRAGARCPLQQAAVLQRLAGGSPVMYETPQVALVFCKGVSESVKAALERQGVLVLTQQVIPDAALAASQFCADGLRGGDSDEDSDRDNSDEDSNSDVGTDNSDKDNNRDVRIDNSDKDSNRDVRTDNCDLRNVSSNVRTENSNVRSNSGDVGGHNCDAITDVLTNINGSGCLDDNTEQHNSDNQPTNEATLQADSCNVRRSDAQSTVSSDGPEARVSGLGSCMVEASTIGREASTIGRGIYHTTTSHAGSHHPNTEADDGEIQWEMWSPECLHRIARDINTFTNDNCRISSSGKQYRMNSRNTIPGKFLNADHVDEVIAIDHMRISSNSDKQLEINTADVSTCKLSRTAADLSGSLVTKLPDLNSTPSPFNAPPESCSHTGACFSDHKEATCCVEIVDQMISAGRNPTVHSLPDDNNSVSLNNIYNITGSIDNNISWSGVCDSGGLSHTNNTVLSGVSDTKITGDTDDNKVIKPESVPGAGGGGGGGSGRSSSPFELLTPLKSLQHLVVPQPAPSRRRVCLDVPCMVAYISNTSNGHSHHHFKDKFLREQAMWEREQPVKPVIDGYCRGAVVLVAREAVTRLHSIVAVMAGPCELARTQQLMRHVTVVPDCDDAAALLSLCGGISASSRLIYGTALHHRAPLVTANRRFVRSAATQGVVVAALMHSPRALTEQKLATEQ